MFEKQFVLHLVQGILYEAYTKLWFTYFIIGSLIVHTSKIEKTILFAYTNRIFYYLYILNKNKHLLINIFLIIQYF